MVVSLNVNNTGEAIAELKVKGYQFIPDKKGNVARSFRNCEFALIHPGKLNGVLAELIDCQWSESNEGK